MHEAHDFLRALTIVLCVAAVTTVVFQRLRQPVVLGYILAGLIIGPHVPLTLVSDSVLIRTLSEIGVILLMFSLGLEFSLRRLIQVGPTAFLTAVAEMSLMMWLGFTTAQILGWTTLESLFTGAVVAISSTTIVAKAFQEQKVSGKLREIVVGVLIAEDLIAILLMATLTAIATGSGLAAGPLALTVGKLAAFLVGLVVVGLLLVPRAVRTIIRLNRPETTVVASIGLCFALALLADRFGYSVALGAFIAGALVAESGEEKGVERLIEPVRDMFAAVFFVSVGMLIDPSLIMQHWGAIVVLTLVIVCGKIFGVSIGAFLTGNGMRTSVQAGMSLAQIGEFSFIIAGLGMTLGATGNFLYPVAIVISALTTLTTPWLIRASGPVASWIDRKLPRPLQTFSVLYGSWIEGLKVAPQAAGAMTYIRSLVRRLFLDAALLGAIVIGIASSRKRLTAFVQQEGGLPENLAHALVLGTAVVLSAPFVFGIVRVARKLGALLAEVVLPAGGENRVDLAAAPRRVLAVTLQLVLVLLIGVPLVAFTRPFLPGSGGAVLVVFLLAGLGISFWRSAANLEGHVRAGSEVIVDALARQSRSRGEETGEGSLREVEQLMPGIGALTAVRLCGDSLAVGKTLAELNLRGQTGATVLAISRQGGNVVVPTAKERLREGDVLALTGAQQAIAAAREMLNPTPGATPEGPPVTPVP